MSTAREIQPENKKRSSLKRRFFRFLLWISLVPAVLFAILLLHNIRVLQMSYPVVELIPMEGSALSPEEEGVVISGAYHIHTTESDGKGDLYAVIDAASAANLDFVVITDHNVEPPKPQFIRGILVVPGVELSTSYGHITAIGASRTAQWGKRQKEPVGAARYSGGMAVPAHPVNRRIPWTGSLDDVDGMEIVSGDSMFREAIAHPFRILIPAIASAPASTVIGSLYLQERSDETFELWDSNPHLQGLCAHDAHGYEGYYGPFATMQLRVRLNEELPDDPAQAVKIFVEALMSGDSWCTLGGLADPSGFIFRKTADSIEVSLKYEDLPDNVMPEIVLYRDGHRFAGLRCDSEEPCKKILSENKKEGPFKSEYISLLVSPAMPGLYRAEIYLDLPWVWGRRNFLWIITNRLNVEKEKKGG